MISRLKLIPPVPASGVYPSGWYESKGNFIDFSIDGRSLWQILGEPDMKSVIWTDNQSPEIPRAINRLLLREPAQFAGNRVPIFVCSLCGDIGCGAITAVVEADTTSFTWHDFGLQNNYEEEIWKDHYQAVGPFTFDRVEYEREFEQELAWFRSKRR